MRAPVASGESTNVQLTRNSSHKLHLIFVLWWQNTPYYLNYLFIKGSYRYEDDIKMT